MRQLPDSSRAKLPAPRERGPVPRLVTDFAPLVALGVLFISSDPRFTFTGDEAATLNLAAQPLRAVLSGFRSGASMRPHPPLYDLLLHFWLLLTGGSAVWLRIPAMICFLAGVWLLSRAASRLGGEHSGTSMIWLVALGPFGFHYARLLSGYSFSFLLIAALTWAYLRHAAEPSQPSWALVCALAVLLIWTSYFAWIVLALLALEELFRNRDNQRAALQRLAIAAGVLFIASIPLWRPLSAAAKNAMAAHLSAPAAVFNIGYSLYVLGVSESVAPWYWKFGVPAAVAVVVALVLVSLRVRGQAGRFLIYGAVLLVILGFNGSLKAESILLAAPWFFLPAAVVIGTAHSPIWRRVLAVSLAVIAGLGWYGVVARLYYASPRFVEPWGDLAVEAGRAVRDGGAVVANDPSLFLYLTYALRVPEASPWRFVGSLPTAVTYPQVWGPDDWQAAGRPLRPTFLFIASVPESDSMNQAAAWLDHNCGDRTERRLVRDPGFAFKQRFLHQAAATPWLIEFRQYSCGGNGGSQEASPAPAQ